MINTIWHKESFHRIALCFGVLLCLISFFPYQVSAQQASTEEKNELEAQNEILSKDDPISSPLYSYEEPKVEQVSYAWLFARTLLILGFLGAGVYFTVRFLAKKGGFQSTGKSVMATLSILPVGNNRQLQVVECGARLLVLGVTDSQISLLREITDKDEIDRIKLQASRALAAQSDATVKYFSDHFESFIRSVGTTIGRVMEKKQHGVTQLGSISVQEFEAAPDISEIAPEKEKENSRYSFFDDERIDYLNKQKSRLKNLNRFGNE